MDITLRTWILIIALFVLVGIVLDGIRRSRNAQAEKPDVKLSDTDDTATAAEELVFLRSELPNGGARKVSSQDHNEKNTKVKKINLGEDVPVLMESVPVTNPIKIDDVPNVSNTGFDEAVLDEPDCDDIVQSSRIESDQQHAKNQSQAVDSGVFDNAQLTEEHPANELIETSLSSKIEQLLEVDAYAEKLENRAPVKDVISVNVIAKGLDRFSGPELIHILLACDMRFGEKGIFHRYESPNGTGKLQFSMADVMEPGTFDLTQPDKIQTRGLSFFMGLPGPKDTLGAFDAMAEIAYVISRNLGGEVRDDSHSVMTPQTLEHYRQRIKDFERKQLSLKIN